MLACFCVRQVCSRLTSMMARQALPKIYLRHFRRTAAERPLLHRLNRSCMGNVWAIVYHSLYQYPDHRV
ncbi:hypothetical protein Y032_0159g3315 [Ancylostoma ceylanicum]|uniref:Uncharacterized protein n=1 Tax=Ancylostoma ceylanicum TaxID=53326 RepID=A0A016SXU2_9BILA|nr:hypothetical protein Y032_0159g3315 [Ancylostoma ceylanicum]